MGWSYDFWVGNFYPENTEASGFLTEYSKHFDTVEADSTFYRIPSQDTIEKWREQTPQNFLFSAKFPRIITHKKMLKDCEEETQFFLNRISSLQKKLGVLLLQFPYAFKPEHFHPLEDYVAALPKGTRFAVEVRNSKLLDERLYSLLRENGVALALVETPFMPETEEITANFTYLRWEGDRRKVNGLLGKVEVDRTDDTKKWAERITKWLDTGIEVFGYFSKYYSGHPPTDAQQLLKLLTRKN
jgi:uncharacterized protein YecE (DUF72 family)